MAEQNWKRVAFAGRYGTISPAECMRMTGYDLNEYNKQLSKLLEEENKRPGD